MLLGSLIEGHFAQVADIPLPTKEVSIAPTPAKFESVF